MAVTTHAHRDAKLLPAFSTKRNHKFTKNTIPPAILFKYFAYLCTKLISMEEYLIISNANFLLREASDNDKWSIVVKGNRQVQGEENQGRGYFQNGSKLANFLKYRQ